MTGTATIELRTAMTNLYFKRTLPIHDQVELCLCSRVPAVNASTTQLFEPSGGGYARVIVALNDAQWDTAADGSVYNALAKLFPVATTGWGYLPGWAIVASKAGGGYTPRVLATGRLLRPVKVAAGDQLRLAPGTVSFVLVDAA